jgi:predicted nuclease of predicted toxin-antitoxin system
MKLLLDENLPKKLKKDFPEHTIFTVREQGWQGKKNGALIELMLKDNFDVLLTFDKNLQFQQNFSKYSVAVFILQAPDNTYLSMRNLIPKIKEVLKAGVKNGVTTIAI